MSFKSATITMIVLIISFLAYKTMPHYYAYYDLLGYMQAQINKSDVFSDDELRQNVFAKAQKLGIPIEKPSQIDVEHTNEDVVMNYYYEQQITVETEEKTYRLFTLEFPAEVVKE